MGKAVIVYIAICFAYYTLGGLATTNILRLTKGNTLTITDPHCICGSCGKKITPLMQMPIISYIVFRGRCKYCGVKIPIYGLLLELVVFCGMTAITWLLHFSPVGVLMSFLYYGVVRIAVVIICGRRDDRFFSQYLLSVLMNGINLLFVEFFSLIGLSVSGAI